MNPRLRRLAADHDALLTAFAGHPAISITPTGARPPEHYQVTYSVPSLALNPANQVIRTEQTHIEIYLPPAYPREKPYLTTATPVFHPNFGAHVCIADHWSAGQTLVDIVTQVGDMLQWRTFNTRSPLQRGRRALGRRECPPGPDRQRRRHALGVDADHAAPAADRLSSTEPNQPKESKHMDTMNPSPPATPSTLEVLEIGWEDLNSPETTATAAALREAQKVPLVRQVGAPEQAPGHWYNASLVQSAFAGLLGGVVTWGITELLIANSGGPRPRATSPSP